ncbi:unnamed protein product [Camellia sinensis]
MFSYCWKVFWFFMFSDSIQAMPETGSESHAVATLTYYELQKETANIL